MNNDENYTYGIIVFFDDNEDYVMGSVIKNE